MNESEAYARLERWLRERGDEAASAVQGWVARRLRDDLWQVSPPGRSNMLCLVSPALVRMVVLSRDSLLEVLADDFGLRVTGETSSDSDWAYYLLAPGGAGDAEEEGEIFRVRQGDSLAQGCVASSDGEWVGSDALRRALLGGGSREVTRIGEKLARRLLTRWVAARLMTRLPEDIEPVG